jgi:hypothetical protein
MLSSANDGSTVNPRFKYTTDARRQRLIGIMEPHLPTFMTLIKEIPWTSFVANAPKLTARCAEIPYVIKGGAVYAEYEKLFPGVTPHLEELVDPTADIDVLLTPLVITSTDPKDTKIYPVAEKNKPSSLYKKYMEWLYTNLVELIKNNIAGQFPKGQDIENIEEYIEKEINQPGLFKAVTHVTSFHPIYVAVVEFKTDIKLEVVYYDDVEKRVWEFLEVGVVEPSKINEPDKIPANILTAVDGTYLNSFASEMYLNLDSIKNRLSMLDTDLEFKCMNHIQRVKYLLGLFEYLYKQGQEIKGFQEIKGDLWKILNMLKMASFQDKLFGHTYTQKQKEKVDKILQDLVADINKHPLRIPLLTIQNNDPPDVKMVGRYIHYRHFPDMQPKEESNNGQTVGGTRRTRRHRRQHKRHTRLRRKQRN